MQNQTNELMDTKFKTSFFFILVLVDISNVTLNYTFKF